MVTRTAFREALLALGVALGGCSSTTSGADAALDRPDVPADAAVDVAADTPSSSPCPVAQPSDGESCTRPALQCEYSSDPRRECRPLATCESGRWSVRLPDTTSPGGRPWCTSPPPAVTCPATLSGANGQPCDAQGAVCTYGGLVCECTSCVSFPVGTCSRPRVWLCDATPLGCPQSSPRIGEPCSEEALSCNYGCNSPNGSVRCHDGVWQQGDFRDCPISLRRYKRDLEYLTPAQVDALARQVRSMRLATWEYTLPSMAGRRRLGFVLEDQPSSYAADPERSQVDLYGFASLLAATVQAQDRELRALRARVDTLEGRRAPRPRR